MEEIHVHNNKLAQKKAMDERHKTTYVSRVD